LITILHGTAEERLKEIPDGSIALTNTSPPYSTQRAYANGHTYNFEAIVRELYRVTKPGGVVCFNEGLTTRNCNELSDPYEHVLGFKAANFKLLQTTILVKDSLPFGNRYKCGNQMEFLWVFLKSDRPATFNKEALRTRPNAQAGKVKNAAQGRRGPKDEIVRSGRTITIQPMGYESNVWKVPVGFNKTTPDHIAHQHPAIQSECVAERVIKVYSNPGDTILDPFNGSGSTMKQAALLGRHGIGIEKAKAYVDLSVKRLALHGIKAKLR
jgi:site-specific DNA-methyltransferase (adenine-specific)